MKVRIDFVTNSSSSAFVILINRENWDEVTSALTNNMKALLEEIAQESNVFGTPVFCIEGNETHGYSSWEYVQVELEGEESVDDVFEDLMNLLENKGIQTWTHSIDIE
jgi:hypothetical protein